MNSIVLSTANAKTSESNRLRRSLTMPLRLQDNLISLSHCSIWYTWKNFTQAYGNTAFSYVHIPSNTQMSASVPDGSYSVRDINNFIHQTMLDNGHQNSDETYDINVYANNVYNRVTITVSQDYLFVMRTGFRETLGFDTSQASLTNGQFNGNLVPKIEKVDTVLIHCNLVNNQIVSDSSILHSFIPNQSFGTILEVKPNYPQWRFARNATFNEIEVWFTDQSGNALAMEDNILVELQIRHKRYNLE